MRIVFEKMRKYPAFYVEDSHKHNCGFLLGDETRSKKCVTEKASH